MTFCLKIFSCLRWNPSYHSFCKAYRIEAWQENNEREPNRAERTRNESLCSHPPLRKWIISCTLHTMFVIAQKLYVSIPVKLIEGIGCRPPICAWTCIHVLWLWFRVSMITLSPITLAWLTLLFSKILQVHKKPLKVHHGIYLKWSWWIYFAKFFLIPWTWHWGN